LARHVCDNCGATVGDEEFCPTCGSWLEPVSTPTRKAGEAEYEEFTLSEAPPPGAPGSPPERRVLPQETVACPVCGFANPATNRHCEECGARLSQAAMPVAPRPAVTSTAGTRAVMAISGILFGVVVIALLFNLFAGGDEEVPDAGETTTTSTTEPTPAPQTVLRVECVPPGLGGSFVCENLINEREGEWQLKWTDLAPGETATVTLNFAEPIIIRAIEWVNLPEGDRFLRNYRARTVFATTDGNPVSIPLTLADQPGSQVIEFSSLRTLRLELEISDVYEPQVTGGDVFTELAVNGINIIGFPAPSVRDAETTTTTAGG
jgi:RNA polymerase subunit RPABC4/transcription elongation factor Spt4